MSYKNKLAYLKLNFKLKYESLLELLRTTSHSKSFDK